MFCGQQGVMVLSCMMEESKMWNNSEHEVRDEKVSHLECDIIVDHLRLLSVLLADSELIAGTKVGENSGWTCNNILFINRSHNICQHNGSVNSIYHYADDIKIVHFSSWLQLATDDGQVPHLRPMMGKYKLEHNIILVVKVQNIWQHHNKSVCTISDLQGGIEAVLVGLPSPRVARCGLDAGETVGRCSISTWNCMMVADRLLLICHQNRSDEVISHSVGGDETDFFNHTFVYVAALVFGAGEKFQKDSFRSCQNNTYSVNLIGPECHSEVIFLCGSRAQKERSRDAWHRVTGEARKNLEAHVFVPTIGRKSGMLFSSCSFTAGIRKLDHWGGSCFRHLNIMFVPCAAREPAGHNQGCQSLAQWVDCGVEGGFWFPSQNKERLGIFWLL